MAKTEEKKDDAGRLDRLDCLDRSTHAERVVGRMIGVVAALNVTMIGVAWWMEKNSRFS